MNKGGTMQFNEFKFTMVHAVHSIACASVGCEQGGGVVPGGDACAFIVTTPDGHVIYHAGDTDVFSDMQIFSELHQPSVALLPIGDCFTMGPKGAAYAVNKLLLSVKTVIPMHYGTFPLLTGTPEEMVAHVTRADVCVRTLAPGETLAL
eukprot:Colp12_sorted_trinity150504_noHs@24598